MTDWCAVNGLALNDNKCFSLQFSKKRVTTTFVYTIGGGVIERVREIKDLGICIDHQLTFQSHYRNIAQRAYRNLGFIYRTCKDFTCINSLKTLYFALVRSGLEYASQVWSPHTAGHKHIIERVQRKFTRFLCYRLRIPSSSYTDRLGSFSVMSLEDRRSLLDMLHFQKIIQGAGMEEYGLTVRANPRNLRRVSTFDVPAIRSDVGRWTNPVTRIVNFYNNLQTGLTTSIFESTRIEF